MSHIDLYIPGRDCVAAAVLVGAYVDAIVLTRVLLRASGVVESSTATLVLASVLVVTSVAALVVTDRVAVIVMSTMAVIPAMNHIHIL